MDQHPIQTETAILRTVLLYAVKLKTDYLLSFQEKEAEDVYCFGHVLYEMAFGDAPRSSTLQDVPPNCPSQLSKCALPFKTLLFSVYMQTLNGTYCNLQQYKILLLQYDGGLGNDWSVDLWVNQCMLKHGPEKTLNLGIQNCSSLDPPINFQ